MNDTGGSGLKLSQVEVYRMRYVNRLGWAAEAAMQDHLSKQARMRSVSGDGARRRMGGQNV